MAFHEGSCVSWRWGGGTAYGTVREIFRDDVERSIKGQPIKRNASAEEPAYLIEQDDGDVVLKSHSELTRA